MSLSSTQNQDRFISLPNTVRDHILSFLPMEDAAKTSFLSRQWRHSCSSLSNLEFEQGKFVGRKSILSRNYSQWLLGKKIAFKNFVDHLLIQHDHTDIRTFYLSMSIDPKVTSNDHIKTWILFAILHNVRELVLDFDSGNLPYSFFTCSSLNLLSLSNVLVKLETSNIYLPNLDTLKLYDVVFYDPNVAENLFSNCPVLQFLTLEDCNFVQYGETFTISALKLRQLNYTGDRMPHISSETLSSLKDVIFVIEKIARNIDVVLMGLHSVETLTLGGKWMKVLHIIPSLFSSRCGSCCCLKHLDLDIWPFKGHFELVINMLRVYSNLETLRINLKDGWHDKSQSMSSQPEESLTGFLVTHLKGVEIQNFGRRDKLDLQVVRFLLENAISLEKMILNYGSKARKDAKLRMSISEMILSYEMASPSAVIEFFGEE